MNKLRTVFRMENPVDMDGMWYTKEGLLRKRIDIICPDGISKDFPMPLNLAVYRQDGRVWNSAGKSVEQMNRWFAPQDARNLYNAGFKLFQFETVLYKELEHEIIFCREGVVSQTEIGLETVFDLA